MTEGRLSYPHTLDCTGTFGSVLVSGTNGVVVQAAPSDIVILRGIRFDGVNTGLNAIRFLSGNKLIVDRCDIFGFTQNGVDVSLGATGTAAIRVPSE